MAVKAAILPVPLAASPMAGLVLFQLYTMLPPVVGLLKFTAVVSAPLHNVWLPTAFTVAVGLTVIVKLIGVPTQPAATGVTVIVATSGPVVPLVVVNGAISPEPAAANPMAGLLLVQLNTVPGTVPAVPLNGIGSVITPLQYTLFDTGATVGVGLTVIVKVFDGPVQVVPPLV